MGDLRHEIEECPEGKTPYRDIVDFILYRADAAGISTRQIGLLAKLSRGRTGNILHRDPAKRRPIRNEETVAILSALKISHLEAYLAHEMLTEDPSTDQKSVLKIVLLVTEIFRGLPMGIAKIIEHVEGLDLDDVRPEHGQRMQMNMLKLAERHYSELVARREWRLDEDTI